MRGLRMLHSIMSPERFVELRRTIGWTRRELARLLGCSENTLRQMEAQVQGIPAPLAKWLERLARCHEQNPPPAWRTR
jgi:DNA-binding transcriptional regulator YiaG